MICDKCGKNEATIHMKNIYKGKVTEYHICERCAKSAESLETEGNFFIEVLMTGIISDGLVNSSEPKEKDSICKCCGITYSDFRKSGSVGCEYCYDSFRDELRSVLARINGGLKHRGKIPRRIEDSMKTSVKIDRLKSEMDLAVEEERFEDAAEYRDRIRELEQKTGKEE